MVNWCPIMDDPNKGIKLDMVDDDALPEDDEWLMLARDAHEQSTDWFDASLRAVTEKAMAHFAGRHAAGSKYHSDSYKFRAKGFRPKTRATIRKNEAAAATAFFSTQDMVSVVAQDSGSKEQVLSAAILSELVNYRLDDSIPWFLTLIGAYQSALNTGVTISHQYWDFEEATSSMPMLDEAGEQKLDDDGQPSTLEFSSILSDKPRIDLVAIENFRISPGADWSDPIGTTPYIIEMIPMFIGDVTAKMDAGVWISHDEAAIQQSAESQYDSIRASREGGKRQDISGIQHTNHEFDTVWVHRNIIRKNGRDWLFYTLGTQLRLSEPVSLEKEYRHLRRGERPYAMGFAVLEAHKVFPCGLNELTFALQEEANDINNQRRDNVTLILNKRYFAKRSANIDYKSLTRNVPGSVTLVDDIANDIRWDSPGEVTGSSYQEQDRISADYDELSGSFSSGSVMSNRKLNETVGGMNMLAGESNVITEYQLRVFAETWVEPVLKQLVRMEQAYETDELVLGLAAGRAQALQKFGVDRVTDQLLQGMVTVSVNVGFGATNPQQRIEKLAMGLQTVGNFTPAAMQGLDAKEVITEVFGALGYKGAERFFPKLSQEAPPDPQIQQMQQQLQELQQIVQSKQTEVQGRLQVEQVRQDGHNSRTQMELQSAQVENDKDRMLAQWVAEVESQLESARLAGDQTMGLESLKAMLAKEAAKLRTQKELAYNSVRPAAQVATPPTEPLGRAPNGYAFQR